MSEITGQRVHGGHHYAGDEFGPSLNYLRIIRSRCLCLDDCGINFYGFIGECQETKRLCYPIQDKLYRITGNSSPQITPKPKLAQKVNWLPQKISNVWLWRG